MADPSPDFDWDLVRSFLAVMDAGSLLGASRVHGATQPTLGRHVEALERQLGKVLFERTGRGLVPTDDARLIAAHARRMRSDADALALAVAGSAGERGGLVRVAASRVVAAHVLPGVLAELQRRLPRIDVAIVASDDTSNLLRRQADIALRHVRPEQSSLVARKLGSSMIRACASSAYLAGHGTPATVEALLRHRLVGADRDAAFHAALGAAAGALGIDVETVRLSVRSDDHATRFAAVRAGLGIGFCPSHAIDSVPDVVSVPVELDLPVLPMWLVVHREIRTAARIREVYDALGSLLPARL